MTISCLQCGDPTRFGGLCTTHAEAVSTSPDLTAEQVSARAHEQPAACLIDQWGNAHAIGPHAVVGRVAAECQVTILHHSVSAIHAQLERPAPEDEVWQVSDRGSLNGTYVEDELVRTAPLHHGKRVRFGSVSFFFASRPVAGGKVPLLFGHTVRVKSREVAFEFRASDESGVELALVQRATGGIVTIDETPLELARLEFSLLKILAERRKHHGKPELSFVSSQELADRLEFKSPDAGGDNVRELVRRVRRKLKTEGIDDLIESRQGVGYRLAWSVKG